MLVTQLFETARAINDAEPGAPSGPSGAEGGHGSVRRGLDESMESW